MSYNFLSSNLPLLERILEAYPNLENYEELLNDNFSLDLNQDLLIKAKEVFEGLKDKKVLIIGDFDCDGICATTIIKNLLDKLKVKNNYYIPSRFKEGYGLNLSHVTKAIDFNFDVLLTVDNGIVAQEELLKAKEARIYTIVIDHHEYDKLPDADFVLHGNLLSKQYQKSCASGLCFLISSLFIEDMKMAVYAGIATNADMVEVFGYNRYLIKQARDILNSYEIKNINALSGKKKNYTYDDLSFLIASKINSVSRLDNMTNVNYVVSYLLQDDDELILRGAEKIKRINNLRKDLSDVMATKALSMVDDCPINVIYDEHFHEGLCGLVANKISRQFQKPCIVLANGEKAIKGSGRSAGDFDILMHLKQYESLLLTLGGHKQAIGISLDKERLESFKQAMSNQIDFQSIKQPCIKLGDDEINDETLKLLLSLQPFGTGFEEPLFYLDNVNIKSTYLIKQKYMKFRFENGLEGICFRVVDTSQGIKRVVGYLKEDSYRKNRLSMQIQDIF